MATQVVQTCTVKTIHEDAGLCALDIVTDRACEGCSCRRLTQPFDWSEPGVQCHVFEILYTAALFDVSAVSVLLTVGGLDTVFPQSFFAAARLGHIMAGPLALQTHPGQRQWENLLSY